VRRVDLGGTTKEIVAALSDWVTASDDEPLVVETSGSTGTPKRVVLTRRAVLASVAATARRLDGEGRWLLALPASYVAGAQVVCRSAAAGEPPVLLDDHPSLAAAVEAGRPAYASLVPTQLHRMLEDAGDVDALRSLRTVLLGGGPVDPALRTRATEAGVTVVATYGSAETAGGCVYDGVALDGVRLATETDGRLRISGPMLFDGYDGDPELTARVLLDGWFRTEDAARIDEDGRLQVLGRLDDIVITGGVNVPAPAVARRLREHPGVRAAEVLGVPDAEWGMRLVAFVVGAPDVEMDLAAARAWVAEVHPRSWAPRQLVVLGALPLLANGKVDRVQLATTAASS
jgi:O-succinylbenzoic acid--CoA ligase